MKRYFLGYGLAYLASVALFGVMFLFGISRWFFGDTPLWFDILFVVVTALPVLALGEVFGRRPKAKLVEKPIRGLLILLAVMALLALISGLEDALIIVSWPGLLLGNALQTLLQGSNSWDGAFILVGNLLVPCLFHLGWHWGTTS